MPGKSKKGGGLQVGAAYKRKKAKTTTTKKKSKGRGMY